jgi:hypothetical protein
MNRSSKEKEYDNKTAKYIIAKDSTEEHASIASDSDKLSKAEESKIVTGKEENDKPGS